jgi:citrate lyase subunit beta/citryl-CoA lyase
MALPVTYLFVPGDRPERFDRAAGCGAEAIVLDLEDAVHPDKKADARAAILTWCKATTCAKGRILVRINGTDTPWYAQDLALLQSMTGVGAILPKAEELSALTATLAALGAEPVLVPLIESARGLRAADSIAAIKGVQRLAFGTLDFACDLGLSDDERALMVPAMQIALASRCAGLAAPIAGVTSAIHDDEAITRDVAFARAFGFSAKLCIHPRQVEIVRAAFAPSTAELGWAHQVLAAEKACIGVAQVNGRMVDAPVLRKARSIIELARTTSNQKA